MSLLGPIYHFVYETAAKGKSYEHFLQKFDENEKRVYKRMVDAKDTSFSRKRGVHVIGIERWGTHRLRVLLGDPLVMDEYDGYAPSETLSIQELAEEFKQTRAETVALVYELQKRGIPLSQSVRHNEAGDLSVGAWLFYLENHIGRETTILPQRSKDEAQQNT